jgi:hypothetical protein
MNDERPVLRLPYRPAPTFGRLARVLLVLLGFAAGWLANLTLAGRYQIQAAGNGVMVRSDRLTGHSWKSIGQSERWVPVVEKEAVTEADLQVMSAHVTEIEQMNRRLQSSVASEMEKRTRAENDGKALAERLKAKQAIASNAQHYWASVVMAMGAGGDLVLWTNDDGTSYHMTSQQLNERLPVARRALRHWEAFVQK